MKQPDEFTYFIDRALGKIIVPGALRAAGARVAIHDECFAPDAADEQWLAEVGKHGWIVLTKDKRFQHRAVEMCAIVRANVRVFNLTAGQIRGREMADIFVSALDKISRSAKGNPAPFIARIARSGRISIAFSRKDLRRYR